MRFTETFVSILAAAVLLAKIGGAFGHFLEYLLDIRAFPVMGGDNVVEVVFL